MKPSGKMFPHTVDHHTATITKDNAGAISESWSAATTGIVAFVQPAPSSVVEEFAQRDEAITHTIYIQSGTVYDTISVEDRIVFDSQNFRVKGRKNPCELDRVFRIDCELQIV